MARRPSDLRWLMVVTSFLLVVAGMPGTGVAGDWPAHRHDVSRSAVADESLAPPLALSWAHESEIAPSPAWPQPLHILNRLDFDYAYSPITGGGKVYYASNADDSVHALDETTGRPVWTFPTGGPIRFAPQFHKGRLYFGSDDGVVYCLDADSGALRWKFRAGPGDDLLIGNGRLMSRWPIRTGVAVFDDKVYFAAGMWSAEGVYLCALDAETGAVVWRNDNAGSLGIFFKGTTHALRTERANATSSNPTHEGEFGETGLSPQGAILASKESLVIPNGAAVPICADRLTGQIFVTANLPPGTGGVVGGSWSCLDSGRFYSLYRYRSDTTGIVSFPLTQGIKSVGVKATLPQPNIFPAGEGSRYRPPNYIHDKGKVSIIIKANKAYSRLAYSMALSGTTLYLGLEDRVVAQDADTERELWSAPVKGTVRELAIANGRLLVSTTEGWLYSFGRGVQPAAALAPMQRPTQAGPSPEVVKIATALRAAGIDTGFAMVVGDADASLSVGLARETTLKIVTLALSEHEAQKLRERVLADTAFHGSRVQVVVADRSASLPLPRYFANAVVVAGSSAPVRASELYRVLRPCGGVLLAPGLSSETGAALLRDAGAANEASNIPGVLLVRPPLPNARDWDRKGAADHAANGLMRLLWFGGPDTALTQEFRQSVKPPLVVSGRYLTTGESALAAVDAYNGTVQWTRKLPRRHASLVEIDGVIYGVAENGKPQAVRTDAAPASEVEKDDAKAPAFDDSKMVSMDASADASDDSDLEAPGIGGSRLIRIASADTAFLVQGTDPKDQWFEFDLRTGAQKRVYKTWTAAPTLSLEKPQNFTLEFDAAHRGDMSLTATAEGLVFTITSRDPVITPLDRCDVFLDFRPLSSRVGLYERGVFQYTIVPAAGPKFGVGLEPGNGAAHPPAKVEGEKTPEGWRATMTIPWRGIDAITGSRATSFGFAVRLWSRDGGKAEKLVTRHLFSDWASEAMNNGWANVFVGAAPNSVERPAIIEEPTAAMRRKYHQMSREVTPELDDQTAMGPRVHPLTGDLQPKIFRPGTGGCGGPNFNATARFGRATGMLGLYDFIDDSGLRTFPGTKAGCSTPITAALGLLLVAPEGGHCVCTFSYPTTLAFAPGDKRLNEDWAIYHDRPADTLVRQAAINLGAFGDRRDGDGTLWLGFPRPGDRALAYPQVPSARTRSAMPESIWLRLMPAAMPVPLSIQLFEGKAPYRTDADMQAMHAVWAFWTPNRERSDVGPYRVNTDIVAISGTDKPWIYGSGYRGVRSVSLPLDFRTPVIAPKSDGAAMKVDGALGDAEWGTVPQATLPFTKAQLFARTDGQRLYLAGRRAPVIGRQGNVSPWAKSTKGDDAEVWTDDSFEFFLSDATGTKVVHLGVSASGARFDALASNGPEDRAWGTEWTSAVVADENGFAVETSIPLSALAGAGLSTDSLALNFQVNQKDVSGEVLLYPTGLSRDPRPKGTSGEAMMYLGLEGRARCRNFTPLGLGVAPTPRARKFTLRLHFAELDDVPPGVRVFDVSVPGQAAIKGLDIAAEAGQRKALVKELPHLQLTDMLTIEFTPRAKSMEPISLPILSAVELFEER